MSRVEKIHFVYTNDTFGVSMGLETVSESVLKDTLMCVEHNLAQMLHQLVQLLDLTRCNMYCLLPAATISGSGSPCEESRYA